MSLKSPGILGKIPESFVLKSEVFMGVVVRKDLSGWGHRGREWY